MSRTRTTRFSVTSLRVWHAGISAFIAPMVLFFSISGALQIFDLHEAHGSYEPSAVIAAMGRVHKNQILAAPPPRPHRARTQDPSAPAEAPDPPTPPATLALRILFAIEAAAFVCTTLIGVWIGVTHPRYARRSWILLALGLVIPAVLLVV